MNSNMRMLNARDGRMGALGKYPFASSWSAAGEHTQMTSFWGCTSLKPLSKGFGHAFANTYHPSR